jgi:hypothetical protein
MRRCPECDFIYEDDEKLCAMDGAELAHLSGPPPFEESVLPQSAALANSHGRGLTLIAASVILAVALFMYFHSLAKRSTLQKNISGAAETHGLVPQMDQNSDTINPAGATPSLNEWPSLSPARLKTKALTNANANKEFDRDPFRAVPVASSTPLLRPSPIFSATRATTAVTLVKSAPTIAKPASESRPVLSPKQENKVSNTNQNGESKISSFLKKTGRVLKKPFKH